ncbi:MAG: superoxide dismutase [Candidatus Micrarchaeota archaeon]|nr:superoxide dismutase [Candidatus Micrarchaeota archaeon]
MFELPKLDYDYNALEAAIDAQTMQIHHTKHHQAYIDNANKALAGTPMENVAVEELLKDLSKIPEDKRNAVRNNAGGHANHALFWKVMRPGGGGEPSSELADAITTTFGGFDKFQERFAGAGIGRFGSGWAWLVSNKGNLEIMSTANQDTPLSDAKTPILGVDVWEHAYYLRYQNKRADYLKAWWNVVNWDYVAELFGKAQKA